MYLMVRTFNLEVSVRASANYQAFVTYDTPLSILPIIPIVSKLYSFPF